MKSQIRQMIMLKTYMYICLCIIAQHGPWFESCDNSCSDNCGLVIRHCTKHIIIHYNNYTIIYKNNF